MKVEGVGSDHIQKQLGASLQHTLFFSTGSILAGATKLVWMGIPEILILLNGSPCWDIVDRSVELFVESLNVVWQPAF